VATSPAALTLVLGTEELLRSRATEAVLRALPGAEVADLTAAGCEPGALSQSSAPSLFAEQRAVVLHGAEDASKALVEEARGLAQAPPPDLHLVVEHAGGAKGKSLVTVLRDAGAHVVDCPSLRFPSEREAFAADEVRRLGGTASTEALGQLVSMMGGDARELASACAQLVADSGGRIDADVVARYHRGRSEASSFVVADTAVDGDAAGALTTLRWALAGGVSPVLVTAALASNLRTIARIAEDRRSSAGALAGRIGMPAWKVRRAQGWLRRWRPEGLAAAVQLVAKADAAVKGGGTDPAYALEHAVLAVARSANGP
jgi:DNA polymerase-3 subunit delta